MAPLPHSRSAPQGAGASLEAGLEALVYVSTARHLLTQSQVIYLLDHARRRNAEYAVTGVLLYSDGNFMQYLEGPPNALARIYQIVRADPLHHGLIELLREPVRRREFARWSMGFRASRGGLAHLEPDIRLERRLHKEGGAPGCCMLHTFWSRGSGGDH